MPKTALEHLEALLEGNARFAREGATRERARLALGQEPYAVILGCADSRVPVETIFERGPGEIFVVRVAGNIVDDATVASIEYAVAVLSTPLVLVLGHTQCGAVAAAADHARGAAPPPGRIGYLIERVLPDVVENVRNSVTRLSERSAVLRDAAAARRIAIRGAVYDLTSGLVRLVAPDA